MQLYFRVGQHIFQHDILPDGPYLYPDIVGQLFLAVHLDRRHITGGGSGIAQCHDKISLFYAFQTYGKGMFCLIRPVFGSIIGRFIVRSGINPEHGKIARMAGPHPVVGVGTEFSDGRRRSSHKPDVGIYFINYQVILIAPVHTVQTAGKMRILFPDLFAPFPGKTRFCSRTAFLRRAGIQNGIHLFGDIGHPFHKNDPQARGGNFLFPVFSPESVFQVIVLHAAQSLDNAVTAMVVGQQQTFPGNDFPGTTAAEYDDGVFQAGMVDIVDVVGFKPESGIFHGFDVQLFQERQQPHPLVCTYIAAKEEQGAQD